MKQTFSLPPDRGIFARHIALIVFCYFLASGYLSRTISIAQTRHFWIDELLAIWAARQPSAYDVVQAIWHGSEYSPPTYDLFLHFLFQVFGFTPLVARLPSILAILLTAGIFAYIVCRRFNALAATLTLGLILNSSLFNYAIEARVYGLLMAVLSIALLFWSFCGAERRNWWQAVGIALFLFLSVCLHFYSIVSFVVFGLIEALWSLLHRRLRPEIWAAFIVAGFASLSWLPLMEHLSLFNDDDVKSPDFYASTTLTHFVEHIAALFYQSKAFALFVFAAVALIAGTVMASILTPETTPEANKGSPSEESDRQNILIVGIGLTATLPIGFALALSVTHVFSARYALPTSIGCILLFVYALRKVPYRALVSYLLLPLLCILPILHEPPPDWPSEALPLLKNLHAAGPIAVTDGNAFIELMGSADVAIRSRLVYLTRPNDVMDVDSTSQLLVKRLATTIRPDFSLEPTLTFLTQHREFVCLIRPNSTTDGLAPWLIKRGYVSGIYGLSHGFILSKMTVGST